LKGKRVAILESRLGREMAELVARRGAVPFHAPALAELPDLDLEAIRALVQSLAARPAKLMVFQTGVGTKALFAATDALGLSENFLSQCERSVVAVRGPKPTGALRSRKVRIDRSAADPFTTKEILESIADVDVKGGTVVIQRFGSPNVELDRALEARGAQVVEIPTYRWSLPRDIAPLEALAASIAGGGMDAVVFTNAEQVRNLFRVAGAQPLREGLNRTLVASIGPVASRALREAGVDVGLEASPPKMGPLLAALDAALSS
jgi:uroporphyrinogen-III synthase